MIHPHDGNITNTEIEEKSFKGTLPKREFHLFVRDYFTVLCCVYRTKSKYNSQWDTDDIKTGV